MSYTTYSEYKNSKIPWINRIPTEWKIMKLKFIFKLSKEKSFEKNPTILSLTQQGIKKRDISTNEGQLAASYEGYNKVKKHDIVMNPMDLISGFVDCSKIEGVISPAYTILKPKLEIDTQYYNYYLQKHYYEGIFFPFAEGVSTDYRWTLKNQDLLNFTILLPPKDQQTQIANFLDHETSKISQIIQKYDELIELLKEKQISLINHAVTKGLDPDVPMKDSGIEWIGEIPKDWKIKKIKFFSELYGRIGFRGYSISDIVEEGEGVITLSPSNIERQNLILKKRTYLSWEKYEESPEIKIFNNDLLLVKTGSSVGKVALVKGLQEPATINPQLVVFKNISIEQNFFYYCFISPIIQNQLLSNVHGGTIPTLKQENIKNYFCTIPRLEEQQKIVSYLDKKTSKIDSLIQKIQNQIELLKEYKISLISHTVIGKIDVRGEVQALISEKATAVEEGALNG